MVKFEFITSSKTLPAGIAEHFPGIHAVYTGLFTVWSAERRLPFSAKEYEMLSSYGHSGDINAFIERGNILEMQLLDMERKGEDNGS